MVQSGWLEMTFGVSAATQNKIGATAVVLLAVLIIGRVILSVVWNRTHDARLRYRWQKGIAYVTSPLAILVIGRIWFAGFQSVATFLGLVSAGIAISLKHILVTPAAWIFIVWPPPFNLHA